MSNLKLPDMTYDNLTRIVKAHRYEYPKLAYATEAYILSPYQNDPYVCVQHHRSTIACIFSDGSLFINNHGYDSNTTRDRINKVINAQNHLSMWGVTQRNFAQILRNFNTGEEYPNFRSANISQYGLLTSFNDWPVYS